MLCMCERRSSRAEPGHINTATFFTVAQSCTGTKEYLISWTSCIGLLHRHKWCQTWAATKYLRSRLDAFYTWTLRKTSRILYTYSPCVKCGSQRNHWLFTALLLRIISIVCITRTSGKTDSGPIYKFTVIVLTW